MYSKKESVIKVFKKKRTLLSSHYVDSHLGAHQETHSYKFVEHKGKKSASPVGINK